MKKTYTKPEIEGELFVVNEAVATCWTVTYGHDNETVTVHAEPVYDRRDQNGDNFRKDGNKNQYYDSNVDRWRDVKSTVAHTNAS